MLKIVVFQIKLDLCFFIYDSKFISTLSLAPKSCRFLGSDAFYGDQLSTLSIYIYLCDSCLPYIFP